MPGWTVASLGLLTPGRVDVSLTSAHCPLSLQLLMAAPRFTPSRQISKQQQFPSGVRLETYPLAL